jgi:hypothetical protein
LYKFLLPVEKEREVGRGRETSLKKYKTFFTIQK